MKPPKKPRPDFPLTPCGNGQWRKIVNKRPYYFGSWRTDPRGEAALKDWLSRKDAILAGLDEGQVSTPDYSDGMPVADLVVKYLTVRARDVESRRLHPDTFRDYSFALNDFVKFLPANAKAVKALRPKFGEYVAAMERRGAGPHAIRRHVTIIKMAFNYAAGEGWIDAVPFGNGFKAPNTDSESVAMYHARKGKEAKTETILTRQQVRRLLRAVRKKPRWFALIMVMLNTAMNPAEVARLRWDEIDFETGRLARRRGKTGIRQEAYLWRQTRKALEAIRTESPLVFPGKKGLPLIGARMHLVGGQVQTVSRWNHITKPFTDLCDRIGLPGVTPYTLRRTVRTWAAHCPDDNAAKRMMGQRLTGQDQRYVRHSFPLRRLKEISRTIYARLIVPKRAKG